MDPELRRKLKDPELIKAMVACIDFDVLAPSLQSRGIMTAAMVDDIREKEGLDERNLCLLHRLPKRGPLAYDRFVSILREMRMYQAVSLLTGEAPPEPPASTSAPPSPPHNVYSMIHSPRGMCIIINNHDFGGLAPQRDGSELDVLRMKALFEAFHFNCIVRSDLSAQRMKALLSWAAQSKQQQGADCLVVILMSHGKQDLIDGSDGEQLHLVDDVYSLFNNENCPSLQGKPKLFFIQACRGGA
ncbi:hypothetical protein HPB50_008018 [Hyalomma asiaticum]|uniref:Uncharacterized protein n=1 Tax=Hyalomma asiaticum TaxID=266040 RepID=A0ACB7SBS0_HYAAI|nr:hypothetical protein HPB50_008018 [Hyalomma asiaticum]